MRYREISNNEKEVVMVEIWTDKGSVMVINLYNPCKKLQKEKLEELVELSGDKVVWCGDFNSHSTLWGSKNTDFNGKVIEELLDENGLVCINDGSGTRVNIVNGQESVLDLTLVSQNMASICTWKVLKETTVGSDHYPVKSRIGVRIQKAKDRKSVV